MINIHLKKKKSIFLLAPLTAVLLTASVLGVFVSYSLVSPQPAAAETPFTDFNGDGYADLAIGVPAGDMGPNGMGSVNVIYGSSIGLSATRAKSDQVWTQDSGGIADSAELRDSFGWSLASGDFNDDGYTDLAVGVPGESVGTVDTAGAVNVIYGSSQGLKSTAVASGNGRDDQFFTQDSTNIEDSAEQNDMFGYSLAAGDFNNDGFADLAIGVPNENCCFSNLNDVGAVSVIYGSSNGLSATSALADQIWLGSSNVQETPEAGDKWGTVLAVGDFNNDGRDDLAVGAPEEDVAADTSAGAVSLMYGSSSGLSTSIGGQTWTQDTAGVEENADPNDRFGSSLATGDFNNDGFDDLAIGVPGQIYATEESAGFVNVVYGSLSGLSATAVADQLWGQSSTNIEDEPEESDGFGSALTTGDFNNDGYYDLAIGVLGENVFSSCPASMDGAVNVIYGTNSGLSSSGNQFLAQQKPLKGTACEGGYDVSEDQLGKSLASGDFNNDGRGDLAIGVPGEGLYDFNDEIVSNAGSVNVIYGSSFGLDPTRLLSDQVWNPSTPSVEGTITSGAFFGRSLATG